MADIDDIMDDIAKELADPNSALNAEMQGRTPENFNQQEELDKLGRELDAMRNAPQAPNPNAPALYENVPVAQAPGAYSLNAGRMSLGGPTVSGQPGVNRQAYEAVAKAGLNPNVLAGVRAQLAYTQVLEETLDPEAAAAAVEAVAAQVAQGQNMAVASAVNVGREVAAANYANTYAADMEALGAPKGYAEDMTSLQGVMAEADAQANLNTIAEQFNAQEALGLTQQAEPAPNELDAMGMMANQAAAEAFSNAIAAGATVAEANLAAENAAETAAQQAANQIGIDPNSPAVTIAALNAANTQAVEVGRLAGMTPEEVAMAAQQAVTAGQQGKPDPATIAARSLAQEALGLTQQAQPTPIGKNTLRAVGLLDDFDRAVTAPEVDARRTREAQELMEQNILAPAPVSPPAPAQNPLGTGRGVPLPTRNLSPAFQNREPVPVAPSTFGPKNSNVLNISATPPVEATLLNPAATPDRLGEFSAPSLFTQVPGLTLGYTNPSPVEALAQEALGLTEQAEPTVTYNAPQISAATQVAPVESFFSAPEPVDPDATLSGPGAIVSGVQSSVPGISISSIGMPGLSDLSPGQAAQVERGNMLGSLSLAPDLPSRNPRAITSMMDVEAAVDQQQAQRARAAINSMMALEANQAKAQRADRLGGLVLEAPAPTTSRSSSSRGGSRGRSSSSRSSKGAAKSTGTRTAATWTPDGRVSFSQEAASPSDPSKCYIATDAVSSGAFSKLDKAKAELWCKRALHNHWAGETVRLGYQALSKRAVANGTASKHYDEFQRFVRYGRGLDKTLKGAVTFYTRMAQFFAVGVINRLKAR